MSNELKGSTFVEEWKDKKGRHIKLSSMPYDIYILPDGREERLHSDPYNHARNLAKGFILKSGAART